MSVPATLTEVSKIPGHSDIFRAKILDETACKHLPGSLTWVGSLIVQGGKWKEMLCERRDRGTLIAVDVPVSKDRQY